MLDINTTQTPAAPATRRFTVTVHETKTTYTEHTFTLELPEGSTLDAKGLEALLRGPGDDQGQPVGELLTYDDDYGTVSLVEPEDQEVGGLSVVATDLETGSEDEPYDGTEFVLQSVEEVTA